MSKNFLKNIHTYLSGKIVLLSFFLCCAVFADAQSYVDTTVIQEGIKEEPSYEESADEDNEDGVIPDFLPLTKGDTLRIQVRKVPDSLVRKMQDDDDFWYANTDIARKKKKPESASKPYIPIGQQTWFKTLFWLIIIGVFAAAIMFYLADSNVGLFRKKKKAFAADVEEEEIPEDIFAINYQKEIDKATVQGNYRMAVRLMFLRLLKNMSEKNIIRYQHDKTNLDYLMQLYTTGYYKDFFRITRNYEYSWYGKFDVSQEAYQLIRNDFELLANRI